MSLFLDCLNVHILFFIYELSYLFDFQKCPEGPPGTLSVNEVVWEGVDPPRNLVLKRRKNLRGGYPSKTKMFTKIPWEFHIG